MNSKLKTWIDETVSSGVLDLSAHVDWFLGKSVKINCDATLSPSVDIYLESVEYLVHQKIEKEYTARLYIPFTWTDGILFHDGHYYYDEKQPPSIYITQRSLFLRRPRGEFYQKTIPAFDARLDNDSFHTYYRCGIYHINERFYDLDYSRAVFVEHLVDFKK